MQRLRKHLLFHCIFAELIKLAPVVTPTSVGQMHASMMELVCV